MKKRWLRNYNAKISELTRDHRSLEKKHDYLCQDDAGAGRVADRIDLAAVGSGSSSCNISAQTHQCFKKPVGASRDSCIKASLALANCKLLPVGDSRDACEMENMFRQVDRQKENSSAEAAEVRRVLKQLSDDNNL
jgi:hypothetical protein